VEQALKPLAERGDGEGATKAMLRFPTRSATRKGVVAASLMVLLGAPIASAAIPHAAIHQGIRHFGVPGFAGGPAAPRPHFDARYFPRVVRAPVRFHWHGEWAPQLGYHTHRWVFGEILPAAWFTRQFWIVDYYDFDLPPPPIGYAWVRVGPDALLVNLANGMVVEAVYDLFV
jgi:Ni/Co efflux regulator RcnB